MKQLTVPMAFFVCLNFYSAKAKDEGDLAKAWYIVSGPIMTVNWNAPKGEQWIVPVGIGAGKVFKIGKQPINLNAQVFNNVTKPTGVGDWQSRIQLQFIFPK